MRRLLYFLSFGILFPACAPEQKKPDPEKWKTEILDAEKAFAQMAADSGVAKAFVHFAADGAVLQRGNTIVSGKNEIRQYFDAQTLQDVSLQWSPDFVDVAGSGDLGYTYGKYTFSAVDASGSKVEANGIFHTVWKRQPDGQWKFVYD